MKIIAKIMRMRMIVFVILIVSIKLIIIMIVRRITRIIAIVIMMTIIIMMVIMIIIRIRVRTSRVRVGWGGWTSGAAHVYVFYEYWRLWEVHLYVFYVSGRFGGVQHLTNLSGRVGPLKKDLTRAGGAGGVRVCLGGGGRTSGAAHLCVFYASWRLWEAHLYVFYVSGRLWGVQPLTNLSAWVCPVKNDFTRAGGAGGGWTSGAADLCVCYASWWLWEVHLFLFYAFGRFWGLQLLTNLRAWVGPLKKDLTRAGGGGRGGSGADHLYLFCVS